MASYQTLRLWSARAPRALLAFVAGLALTGLVLLVAVVLQPARVVPAFVTHELGAAQSSAKQPQSLASSGLHATVSKQGFTASDGRSKWLTLTNAAAPSADWSYFKHGVARKTSFGTQTITMTPGSIEEFDTIVAHHGVRTWQWHLGSPNLNPYLSPDGSVSFRSGGKRIGLHVLPAQVYDASGNAVTPTGARWSLRRAKDGWLLELRLDDSTLPVPYTIDPSVSSVTFAGSPQSALARSTWTVGFTTSSTGTLAAGSTITVVFNGGFTVPAAPAVTLGPAFANCTAGAAAAAQTVTVTLAGTSCAVAPSTPATLQLAGLTNPAAGSLLNTTFSVKTSVDSTSAVSPGANVVIAAATTPTAVTFASTTLAAAARSTWTVGFSSTATGALRSGDTVTVVFPNATSVFAVPASPTVLLTKGFANCSAAAVGASQTVTITLADNGGTCSLPNSAAAALQILGVTAGVAGSPAAALWQVKTSADTTAGNPAAPPVIAAATAPSAVTFGTNTLAANARAMWTVGFTSSATGSLRTGDTVTVVFPNATSIFTVPATPIVIPTKGFNNCGMTATGASQTVTITLSDNGGTCSLPVSTAALIQIAGVTAGAAGTPANTLWKISTSADTTAANPAAITINAAGTPAAVTFAGSTLAANARATWTIGFTVSGTGNLRTADTITVTFPNATSVFAVPATPTIILTRGFNRCTASATGAGQTVTITLLDSATNCVIANGTVLSFQIVGVTSGAAGSPAANLWQVSTSNDTAVANPAAPPVIAAATTPSAVTFASTTLAATARGTWTVGFTSSASGQLRAGDTVSIAFPNATSIFTVPATPTVLLTKGFTNCAVTNAATVTTTVTFTLADSGGTCSLPSTTAATVQIPGITSGAAGAPAAANWTVKTSVDTTTANVGAAPTIIAATAPSAVTFAATTLAATARAIWTVGFTTSGTGALRAGDTVSVAFPNATSVFTVPASPTVILSKGFYNCSVSNAVTVTTTVTFTLADNGGTCSLPNSSAATVQIPGVKSGAAGSPAAANWTVKTSVDNTATNVGAAPTIAAATTPANTVTFAATTLAATAQATWTVGFTPSATGALRTGDTITIAFPNATSVFTVPASPTVLLTGGFTNCSVSNASTVTTTVTITLADNGGTCSLPNATPAGIQILGITSGAAGSPAAANWTVATSADATARTVLAAPTIGAATTPTAVTFNSTTLAANARATWTVGFTPSGSGGLDTGDKITVVFPNATSVFAVPANPTVILTKGFGNCSAAATGAAQTVTITLADSGGSCSLPNGAAATLQIRGVTSGAAGTPAANLWKVSTSADATVANPAAITIGAATTPTAVTVGANTLVANRVATWTTNFTTSSTGLLQAGDTITVTFSAGFNAATATTVTLLDGFSNCSAGVSGVGAVATITLADSGGTCAVGNSAPTSLAIAGITNTSTTGPSTETVKTSVDTTAANAAAVTIAGVGTPTAVTVSATTLVSYARAKWTVNFTPTSTGALKAGDTVTVTFTPGFSVPATPTIVLGAGFTNCSAAATGAGAVATITLADNGGSCALPPSTAASLTIAGVTNTSPGASVETVKTTADTTAGNAASVTILAASGPTAVSFAGTPQTGSARSTWAIGFTSTSALLNGDTITTVLPAGFSLPPTPTITLTGAGYSSCSATGAVTGTTLTVTLSGASCALTAGQSGAFTVAGAVNPVAGTYANTSFTVQTSDDTTAASPAGNVVIAAATTSTAISFAGTPQTGSARSTWAIGFTSSATGALRVGDTITIGLAAGFSAPTNPTVTLTGGGYTSCGATAAASNTNGSATGPTITVTLTGASCSLANSGNGALTLTGLINPPAQTITAANMTVATSADTVAAAPGANVVIAAATTPTAVSFTGSPQTAQARSTWTIGFTTSATGALHAGDTITVGFSARFSIPSSPIITLTGAYTNCSATGVVLNTSSTTGSNDGPKVVITLADSGGTCTLAGSASGALTIAGIINVIATTITAANLNVLTSTDPVQASPGANVVIAAATAPTAVSFAGAPQTGSARSTWTIGFTSSASGALKNGDTVIIGFSAGFSIEANPTITLGGGYTNCSATGSTNGTAGSVTGPTLTLTIVNNGGTCSLANSGNGSMTIAGVSNPPAQTITNTSLTLSTGADYTAASPAANVTIAGATTPTAVSFTGSPQSGNARSTWTVGYTASATGALKTGDAIKIGFAAGFSIPANPTVVLTGAYTNCSASAVTTSTAGSTTGPTVTVTLANNGGNCALANNASGALTLAGITNPPQQTITAANMTVATTADTTAASPGANVVIAAATTPTAVTFTGAPQTQGARSTWTIGYTASATGALKPGDTISIGFSTGFSIPANPTVTLTGAYTNCSATAVTTATTSGATVVVTLANNGGTCALANSASGALTLAGITNPPQQTITAANLTVATSADTVAASPGANVVIAAATAPTAVTFTGAPQTGSARSTWTIGFTSSASGALKTGDTIAIRFPSGFSIPTNPTITLTGAYATCSATAVTTAGTTVTVTLANNGGACSLGNSASGALKIAGITNPPAGVITGTNFTVATTADTTAASPANVTIAAATAPTAVTFAGSPQTGLALSTWTVGFTSSATGALKVGDTITIGFANGFSIPANPTITLTGAGYSSCAATAVASDTSGSGSGPTVTITLTGASCALANSGAGTLTIAGVTNPPAGTLTGSNFTVLTSADTTPASPANVTIGAATPVTAVTFSGSTRSALATGVTWTTAFTTSGTGALAAGNTIQITYPTGFIVPATPAITLTGAGYTSCTATGATTATTVTITLVGASCALAAGSAGDLTVAGIINPAAGTYVNTSFTVTTSKDAQPGSPGANVDIFGPATALTLSPATGTPTAGAADNLTVTAVDSGGRTVATYTGDHSLTFSGANNSTNPATTPTVTDKTATPVNFGTATTITFANGVSSVGGSMKLYKAESPTVAVTDGTLSGNSSLTVSPAAASRLVVTGSATQTAGAAQALTITATDPYGNTATAYTGAKNLTFSGANSSTNPATAPTVTNNAAAAIAFGSTTAVTFTSGVATSGGSMKLYKAEAATVAVTDGTISAAGADRLSVTVSSAAATRLVVTGSASQTAGTAQALTITATDPYGNTDTTYAGAKSLTFSGANSSTNPVTAPTVTNNLAAAIAFGSTTAVTFTSGGSSSGGSMKLYKAEAATIAVTDGTLSASGTDRLSVTVNPVAATRLVVTGSSPQTAGNAQALTITATDVYGNTDTSYAGAKNLTFSGANSSTNPVTAPTVTNNVAAAIAFGSTTAVTFTSGVSSSGGSMKLYKAEAATISVTDGTLSSSGADRLSVTVNPAAATRLVVTGSASQTAGAAQTVTVTATDAYGNTDTGYSGAKTLTYSGANSSTSPATAPTVTNSAVSAIAFGSSTTNTFTSGVSTTTGGVGSMKLYKAETANVAVTDGTIAASTGTDRLTVTVNPAAATRLVVTGSASQTAGAAQTVTVTATDPYGNTDTGYSGAKTLTYSGANSSSNPVNAPTVTNSGTSAIAFGSSTTNTFTSGVSTTAGGVGSMKLYKVETANIAVTDGTIAASSGTDRLTVTVNPATATRLVVTGSASQTAGAAQTVTVTATDAYGNTDTGYSGAKTLTYSGANSSTSPATAPTVTNSAVSAIAFGSSTTNTFTSGVSTTAGGVGSMKLYKAETANVAVTDGTIAASSGTDRLTVTVNPAAATRLVVTGSASQTAGAAQTVTVTAADPYGNTDTGYSGAKTLTYSGANSSTSPATAPTVTNTGTSAIAFGSSTTNTFTSGVSTTAGGVGSMKLYKAETANIAVTDGTIAASSGTDRLTVTVNPATATRLVVTGSASQTAGAAQTVTVTATDPYGNTDTGYSGAKTLTYSGRQQLYQPGHRTHRHQQRCRARSRSAPRPPSPSPAVSAPPPAGSAR